jgi:C1A family cysteine protease
MTATRRTLLVLVLLALVTPWALPQVAGAAGASPQLELGRLNPAFVEALHNPLVTLGLGRMPSPVEVDVASGAVAKAARTSSPTAFSLVDQGEVTSPVKNQKSYNTCWAFANIAALESKILISQGRSMNLSEDNLVGRSGYWTSRYARYQYGGYDFMAIAYFARWAGPVTEAADPYNGRPSSGKVVRHVEGVTMIPGRSTDLGNDLIKDLVQRNGGLSVGMYMDDGYYDASTDSYYYPTRPEAENHGVVIVGWDDDYPASNFGATNDQPTGNGAFLVRNSWGADWGWGPDADHRGYFWVSYHDQGFARDLGFGTYGGCTSYSEVAGTHDYSRNYGYDKLGVTDRAGFGNSPVWAANKFKAVSIRPITAVSFYTLSSGTPYQVWAGRSFKKLTRRAKGTMTLPGYTTVKFKQPLRVKKGKSFVVAIKLTPPDDKYPLAIERRTGSFRDPDTGYRVVFAPATASRGQSYVGTKRWRMRDLSRIVPNANVCLKAFAR